MRAMPVLFLSFLATSALAASPATPLNPKKVKTATDRCGNWLVEQFDRGDKVFGKGKEAKDVATVALVVLALCDSPRDYKETNGPFVSEPVKFLLSKIKKDGSLKDVNDDEELDAMVWTIAALKSTLNDKHHEAIARCEAHFKQKFPAGLPVPVISKMEQLTNISLQPSWLRSTLLALKHFGPDSKEIAIDGKEVKWGPIIAENLMKLQKENGSFGDDVKVNALALEILNKCYKAMK